MTTVFEIAQQIVCNHRLHDGVNIRVGQLFNNKTGTLPHTLVIYADSFCMFQKMLCPFLHPALSCFQGSTNPSSDLCVKPEEPEAFFLFCFFVCLFVLYQVVIESALHCWFSAMFGHLKVSLKLKSQITCLMQTAVE